MENDEDLREKKNEIKKRKKESIVILNRSYLD